MVVGGGSSVFFVGFFSFYMAVQVVQALEYQLSVIQYAVKTPEPPERWKSCRDRTQPRMGRVALWMNSVSPSDSSFTPVGDRQTNSAKQIVVCRGPCVLNIDVARIACLSGSGY